MEINITDGNFKQWLTERSKIVWDLYSKKALLLISIYFFIGIALVFMGFSDEHKNIETISKSSDQMKTSISFSTIYKDPVSVAISGGFGIGFIFWGILNLISFYKQKTKVFDVANRLIYRHHRFGNSKYSLRLTENEIFYQDSELTYQVKWTIFFNYKIYKGYLMLSGEGENTLMVPLTQLAESDVTTLLSFVKTKLIEKKII